MRQKLLDTSPHVSLKVAYKMADNTITFPHAIAFEILSENPDLLKNSQYLTYLMEKADPMPEYLVSMLYLLKDEETLRTELVSQMSISRTLINTAETEMIRAHILSGDVAAAYAVLADSDCLSCNMLLIESALADGNTAGAEAYLQLLDARGFVKDPISSTEIEQYHRWYNIEKSVTESSRTWLEITPSEQQELADIALQYYYTEAGKRAMNILSLNDEQAYFIPPAYDGSAGFSFRSEEVKVNDNSKELSIYPNPASHILNVEIDYSLSSKMPDQFMILDINGKQVYSIEITTPLKHMSINTSNWASGAYSYVLSAKGEKIDSGKIEVIH